MLPMGETQRRGASVGREVASILERLSGPVDIQVVVQGEEPELRVVRGALVVDGR